MRFPKYVLNEDKKIGRFLVSRSSLPYLCYLLYSFAAFFEESVSVLLSMRGASLS